VITTHYALCVARAKQTGYPLIAADNVMVKPKGHNNIAIPLGEL
jgi:hypothetical protein